MHQFQVKSSIFFGLLTLSTLWANSAGDKLMIFVLFCPKKRTLSIHVNCLILHENVKVYSLGTIRKNISKCLLLNVLPSMLSVHNLLPRKYMLTQEKTLTAESVSGGRPSSPCTDDQGLRCSPTESCIRFYITKTYLYNFDPLKLHFYLVKLGFIGVYIFLFLLKNID